MLEIKNKLGDIRFSRNVILRMVNEAVAELGDKVALQNYRGKYKKVIPGNDDVVVFENEKGMRITVYIVIKFGTSIRESTRIIARHIMGECERIMCEKPYAVEFVITGVHSRKTVRRHIVISYDENCKARPGIRYGT